MRTQEEMIATAQNEKEFGVCSPLMLKVEALYKEGLRRAEFLGHLNNGNDLHPICKAIAALGLARDVLREFCYGIHPEFKKEDKR